MINQEILETAYPLTELLDSRKITVMPIEGTPLANLVSAARAADPSLTLQAEGVQFAPNIAVIADLANAKEGPGDINYHDLSVQEISEIAVPAVQGHISFARTVVNPLVDELATNVTQAVGELNAASIIGAEIIIRDTPEVLRNVAFERLVAEFADVAYLTPKLAINFPDQTTEELVALLKTGSGNIDSDIDTWLAEVGTEFLQELWCGLFQVNQRDSGSTRLTFADWMECPFNGTNFAIATFLWSRKLIDNVFEGVQVDLRTYKNTLAEARNQSGARLAREISKIARNNDSGILVLEQDRLKVRVSPDVYRKFIDEGGSNDVLFGNSLQARPWIRLADIQANAKQLEDAWNGYCSISLTTERNRRFIRVKEILAVEFRKQLERDLAEGKGDLNSVEYVIKTFDKELNELKTSDLDCFYTLSLRLICCARFPETAAFEILSGINRNKEENPKLSIREAALLATFEYVACWVASQIRVIRH